MVKRRYADFKHSHTDTNEAVVPENTKKLYKLVLADRKLKLHEIAEELKISEGSVISILHEHLSIRKLCSKWVLCLLGQSKTTVRQQFRALFVTVSTQKKEFLCMTMDETWIHHFIPGSNQQPAEWKWPKTQTWAGKFLASIFWDVHGIFFINYLKKGITINSKYYLVSLVHLKEEIAKKQPQMIGWLFGFYGISTFVGYLTPNPVLWK